MTELYRLVGEISHLNILKASFSVPYNKESEFLKCTLRTMGDRYQFESFTKTQAFHENVSAENLSEKICTLIENNFRQAEIFTSSYVYGIKISSKGKLLHNRRKNTVENSSEQSHNREKKHIIDLDNAPPVFTDIGIIGKDGKIVSSKYDKYKQICRFVEFIDDVVKKDPREEYNIIDFGCGKSYLTFICYFYMTKIAHKKVNIVGLDLKKKVIDDCNVLAKKYGYDNLSFLCMDIKDYLPKVRPDMVIALHACDVATDYALYNAYRWQADYIFSVPCCQHELNSKIKSENFGLLCDYGLIKERFSALATDALRAKLLEYCGYNVDVLEFIDVEHSPKNILIRARRTTKINDRKKHIIKSAVESFSSEFNSHLALEKLLVSHDFEFVKDDKTFYVHCGKSSMMIKDAMTVRNKVFLDEQSYKNGASRDEHDDTAWFSNVYDADGNVLATSRMIYTEKQCERLIGKIAVLPEYRNSGFGKQMLEKLTEIAREENAEFIMVNAQQKAEGFYRALSFEIAGDAFSDDNVSLVPMKKKI